jgi:hypothetical protein
MKDKQTATATQAIRLSHEVFTAPV